MRYQDYVIKDGQFVGRFEDMYRDCPDPWHCTEQADSWKNHLLLGAVHSLRGVRDALDVGCGQGALTRRLRESCPLAHWRGCDVSPTALEKAPAGVEYFVHDLLTGPLPMADGSLDLITMAEVMWYLLPRLEAILADFRRVLRPGGRLLILQYFLTPEEQGYGKEWVSEPSHLLAFLTRAGFTIEQEAYLGLQPPHDLLVLARC